MNFDTGTYVVIGAMIIFYLRLMQLRGRRRKLERAASIARMSSKNKNRKSAPELIEIDKNKPPYKVTSWALVAIAAALSLLGLLVRTTTGFPEIMQTYWWIITSAGTLLFVFCFKV